MKKETKKSTKGSHLNVELKPNKELAALIGGKPKSRGQCMKQVWKYIEKNDLKDKDNGQIINCDDNLCKAVDSTILMMEKNKAKYEEKIEKKKEKAEVKVRKLKKNWKEIAEESGEDSSKAKKAKKRYLKEKNKGIKIDVPLYDKNSSYRKKKQIKMFELASVVFANLNKI